MGNKGVFASIRAGRIADLEDAAAAGADLDQIDAHGKRALCVAVEYDRPAVVEWLLTKAVDPDGADARGWTPAMVCVHNAQDPPRARAQAEIRRMLEAAGASFAREAEVELGRAAERGDRARVEALLGAGTPCDPPHASPLCLAAQAGQVDVVRVLLNAGAQLERTRGDATALCLAARAGQREVVEQLLRAGADPEPPSTRANATYFAARKHHYDLAKWLEERTGRPPLRRLAVSYRDSAEPPGWRAVTEDSDMGGNDEFSMILFRAPIDRVSPALHQALGSDRRLVGLETDPQLLRFDERARYLVQLVDSPWTLFLEDHGNVRSFDPGERLARTLSAKLRCPTIHATWDDTSCSICSETFEDGSTVARGCDDHAVPKEDPRVPAIVPWDEWGPILIGVGRADVERVDALIVPLRW